MAAIDGFRSWTCRSLRSARRRLLPFADVEPPGSARLGRSAFPVRNSSPAPCGRPAPAYPCYTAQGRRRRSRRFDMAEQKIRAALDRHWAASDANDFEGEHQIYREDAVLEYPQSGERIRGRQNIQLSRAAQPNRKRFTVRRIIGAGDLWVTEYVLTYDGRPSYTVSMMEFLDGKVARETQYFGDPFEPGPSRAQWGRADALKCGRRTPMISYSPSLMGRPIRPTS